ncbi:MAG: ATP-binding protein, partial [Actinomycetales bacterium]
IDRLENDETDPDQLAQLFRLDHLAARMRRNNDNLMVLAGTTAAPRGPQAMPVLDVVRAAVSETEHYQRTTVRGVCTATVTNGISHDLVHLLAELLDNATTYSPPDTTVTVSVQRGPSGGVRIEVTDRGLGIPVDTLGELNAKLASPPVADATVARRMGLYVVAHLAVRHGIEIHLAPSTDGPGTNAVVDVPVAVLTPELTATGEADDEPAETPRVVTAAPGPLPTPAAPVPRRPEDAPSLVAPLTRSAVITVPAVSAVRAVRAVPAVPAGRGLPVDDATDATEIDVADTPIFHELSAWFLAPAPLPLAHHLPAEGAGNAGDAEGAGGSGRSGVGPTGGPPTTDPAAVRAAVATAPPRRPSAATDAFATAADEGWRTAAAVSGSHPRETTAAGLPRRRPMAHHIPGSAGPDLGEPVRRGRDAVSVRRHLTAYQNGLHEGRRRAGSPPGASGSGAPTGGTGGGRGLDPGREDTQQ